MSEDSIAGVAVSSGPTVRPEGEKVDGHAPVAEGSQPVDTLANGAKAPSLSPSSSASSTKVEGAASPAIDLIRASGKIAIDLRGRDDLRASLYASRRLCARAANACIEVLRRADFDSFARIPAGEKVTAKNWPPAKPNLYKIACDAAPGLQPGICASISQAVHLKWHNERFDVVVLQKHGAPFFQQDGAFPLRAQELRIYRSETRDRFFVSFILERGTGKRIALPLEAKDAYQRQILENLSDGEWRFGDAKVQQDRLHPARWFLRLTYKRKVDAKTSGFAAGVNRGLRNFIVAVTDDGKQWTYDGSDIVAYLKQLQRRRRGYQRSIKASNRIGHGVARALKPIDHLSGKGERWRQTKCQTIAARLATWLRDRDIRTVYIEDLSGIRDGESEIIKQGHASGIWETVQEWPYYQLQVRLKSCLEQYGIEMVSQPAAGISTICHALEPDGVCGAPAERDFRRWRLRCPKCGSDLDLDVAAAKAILARGMGRAPTLCADAVAVKSKGYRGRKSSKIKALAIDPETPVTSAT